MTAFPPIWLAAAASLGYFHPDLPLITAAMATFNSLYSFTVSTYVYTIFHMCAYTHIRTVCTECVSLCLCFLSSLFFWKKNHNFFIFNFLLFTIRYFQWDVSMDWGLFTITRNGSIHWRQVWLFDFVDFTENFTSFFISLLLLFFTIF